MCRLLERDFATRAGHATTLPRQREPMYLGHKMVSYYGIMPIFDTPFRRRELNILLFWLISEALINCRVVVVAKLNIVAGLTALFATASRQG